MERQYISTAWSDDRAFLTDQHESVDKAQVLLLVPNGDAADTLIPILREAQLVVTQAVSLDESLRYLAHSELVVFAFTPHAANQHDIIAALRASYPVALRIVIVTNSGDDLSALPADATLTAPFHGPDVVQIVQSQLRTSRQICALEASRATMLATALLSTELTQSLRSNLEAQEVLHHEVLHRVQTHIGALRDYLEIEVRRLPLGIARESMRGVLHRVRNLSSLYETMATLAMEDPIDFASLVSKISQGVKSMYSPRSKLPVVVEGQLLLSATSASPLMLIVNELLTNAYRHAFPGGRFGTIYVSCGRDEAQGWCKVADDGVGMSLPLHTRPNSGSQLVQQLARRSLGGHCKWASNGVGTIAMVQFPLASP